MTPKTPLPVLTIGTALERHMAEKGHAFIDAAELIGCADSTVHRWVQKGVVPYLRDVGGIARYLGVSVEEAIAMRAASVLERDARRGAKR